MAVTPEVKRKEAKVFDKESLCKDYQWANRAYWDIDTPEGKALLGSENGRGFGYLLVQHKSTFGDRTAITGVTMWCSTRDETVPQVNLLFRVSDPV